jgi:hypothetical protein
MTARRWASSTSRGPLAPRVCRVASPRMASIANVCLQPHRSAPPVHRRTSVLRRSTKRTPAAASAPADAETVARWRRRRRRPPPVGRRRPSCARRWSPHTRPARWRWRKHAPTARRCARLRWPGADRHGTHTPAAATNKPDATTVCALHRPPAQPCPCQGQRPGPVGSASVAPPCCLAHAAQSPVAAALHSPDTVRGTARHGTPSAAPKSRDRSGPWRTEIASRRGSAAAPVGSARAGVRVRGWVEHARHTRAWPLTPLPPPVSLSVRVCLCLCEREGQAVLVCFFRRCTWPCPTATASLCVRRAWYCAWPRCVCVCLGACVCYVSVFLCGCVRVGVLPTFRLCACWCSANLSLPWGHGPACVYLRPCVCVHLRLSSFSWHGRGPLCPSLPHTLMLAACGGAGGDTEGQLGRLKQQQQRVHCVGDKGPMGAVWMRRLRHAWGGHSERERERGACRGVRGACRVCLPWRPSSTMRSKSARRSCGTMAHYSRMGHPCPQ